METQRLPSTAAQRLPSTAEMYRAIAENDSHYDGLFYFGVVTTGVFCRPSCRARTPLSKNIRYFVDAADAKRAGYRACKLCRPTEPSGQAPDWLSSLMEQIDAEPFRRFSDSELSQLGVSGQRLRRWFRQNYGITFQHFLRSRRLALALHQLSHGHDPLAVSMEAGYDSLSGFNEAFRNWCGCPPQQAASSGSQALQVDRYLSPLGPIVIAASNRKLFLLEFADRNGLETQFQRLTKAIGCPLSPGQNDIIEGLKRELDQYFAGELEAFETPLELIGTEFQKLVWRELLRIPRGATKSYEEIGRTIGKPGAARAVGRANGSNRLAIVVPCHRVIRSDGQLSGYAGGLRRKEWLLRSERCS